MLESFTDTVYMSRSTWPPKVPVTVVTVVCGFPVLKNLTTTHDAKGTVREYSGLFRRAGLTVLHILLIPDGDHIDFVMNADDFYAASKALVEAGISISRAN